MRPNYLLRLAYWFFRLPEDESPRVLVDIILGMFAIAAVVTLIVYASETNPSMRLKICALASFPTAIAAIVFSKDRTGVILAVVGYIALRITMALTLHGR